MLRLYFTYLVAGLSVFTEPSYLFYQISTPELNEAVTNLKVSLDFGTEDMDLVNKCRKCVTQRVRLQEEASDDAVRLQTFALNYT